MKTENRCGSTCPIRRLKKMDARGQYVTIVRRDMQEESVHARNHVDYAAEQDTRDMGVE